MEETVQKISEDDIVVKRELSPRHAKMPPEEPADGGVVRDEAVRDPLPSPFSPY